MKIKTKFDIGDKFTVNEKYTCIKSFLTQVFTIKQIIVELNSIRYVGVCPDYGEYVFKEHEIILFETADNKIENRLSVFAV